MSKLVDLTSQRFGKLTVVSKAPNIGKQTAWNCRCDCSPHKIIVVRGGNLKSVNVKSGGCLKRKHNLYYHPLYQTWAHIIQRTTNPQCKGYHNYGGRGIKICNQWRHNPKAFIEYCIQLSNWNTPEYSIDRINNDDNYEPGNIRFVNKSIQMKNRRFNNKSTGEKYIYLNPSQSFSIKKRINHKYKHFGSFKTLKEAIKCRDKNKLCE